MNNNRWVRIDDVIPSRNTQVLLYGESNGKAVFSLGELGGCNNLPEMIVTYPFGNNKVIYATHWQRLVAPELVPC